MRQLIIAVLFAAIGHGQILQVIAANVVHGGSFSPSDLSGLKVWYAADFGANCGGACTNGATQTTWADKSSNGNNGTASGNLGPSTCQSLLYNTNQINSHPAVTFNNSPSCLIFATPINLQTASTVFTVMRLTSTGAAQTLMTGVMGSLSTRYVVSGKEQAADNVFVVNFGAGSVAADTSWHQVNMTYNNTTATYRIDRSADGSVTPSSTITTNELGIGVNAGGGIEPFGGQVAEFLIYDRVLSGGEITQVETYLFGKYGL